MSNFSCCSWLLDIFFRQLMKNRFMPELIKTKIAWNEILFNRCLSIPYVTWNSKSFTAYECYDWPWGYFRGRRIFLSKLRNTGWFPRWFIVGILVVENNRSLVFVLPFAHHPAFTWKCEATAWVLIPTLGFNCLFVFFTWTSFECFRLRVLLQSIPLECVSEGMF